METFGPSSSKGKEGRAGGAAIGGQTNLRIQREKKIQERGTRGLQRGTRFSPAGGEGAQRGFS